MSPVYSYVMPSPLDVPDTRTARRNRGRVKAFPAGRIVSIDTDEFDEFNECAADRLGLRPTTRILRAATCSSC